MDGGLVEDKWFRLGSIHIVDLAVCCRGLDWPFEIGLLFESTRGLLHSACQATHIGQLETCHIQDTTTVTIVFVLGNPLDHIQCHAPPPLPPKAQGGAGSITLFPGDHFTQDPGYAVGFSSLRGPVFSWWSLVNSSLEWHFPAQHRVHVTVWN